MTGSVLSSVTLSELLSLSPYPSLTEAVQVMLSLGWAILLVRVIVDPVPMVVPALVQVRVGVRDSLSSSLSDLHSL